MYKQLKGLAAVLAFAGAVGSAGIVQAADLKVAALKGWPPFSGKDLPNKGFSNDLTKTALERLGHSVKVEVMPWARALEMTKRGTFDILPSVWYSKERANTLIYTDPIAKNKIVFIKEKGDPFTYESLGSLEGKTVGIVQGYDYGEKFLNADSFERDSANDIVTNVRKMLAGRVDLTLGDELVSRYAINEKLPGKADQVAFTDGALSSKDLHVTVSRKSGDAESLVENFNAEVEKMRSDGTYDEILERHDLK